MKKIVFLALISVITYTLSAENRRYLLHTDANIARLKTQVKNDTAVANAWNVQYNQAVEAVSKRKLRADECQVLSLAYRMTGEKRFAEAIKKILTDYMSKDSWEGQGLLNRTPSWRAGLGNSHTSFYLAVGFDCAYDYLTDKERKDIAEKFVSISIKPAMEDWLLPGKSIHTFDTMGHNWWSACVYMAGISSLAIRNEIPEATQWAKDIAQTAIEWTNFAGNILDKKPSTFDKDGGFYESVNYANYGISQYLLFRFAFGEALPKEKQVELPVLEKIGDFFINATYFIKDNYPMTVNFGDSKLTLDGNYCVTMLWNLGYKNDRFAWYLQRVSNGDPKDGLHLYSPNGLIMNPDLPKIKSDFKPEPQLSHLYADMGWAMMRNSWDANATMLAVKCGMTWNHSHADAGSYSLFHRGKNLLIDGGNCSYGDPMYTRYFCQSEAHNVVLFNGEGQKRTDPYYGVSNPGSLHNLVEGTDFKYILANATGPYSHILARNYRHFVWVGDVILVIDDLLADKLGNFEWLLHYNGTSKRDGLDLSVKQDNAEVLVRPLFPETFPDGGLPHDFPEKLRLEERAGHEDHHPENNKPYWSISTENPAQRIKFITAIILKTDKNEMNLPVITRSESTDFLEVSITQNGITSQVYLNLLADGRIMHRNSLVNLNGWETDAYLTVLNFDEKADKTKIENVKEFFIANGSDLKRNNEVLIHSLSKSTTLVENFQNEPKLIFKGQQHVALYLHSLKNSNSLKVNDQIIKGQYDNKCKAIQIHIDN